MFCGALINMQPQPRSIGNAAKNKRFILSGVFPKNLSGLKAVFTA
jgi:hypothetical protein